MSAKGYWRQFDPSPDIVVMFSRRAVPARCPRARPSLQEYAWSSNVILASPSTLMVLLRTVAMTWQQETIAESAHEISALGRELYKRLSTMGAHFSKLGRTLDGAVDAYNKTVGSLERQVPCRRAASSSTDHRDRASRAPADRAPDTPAQRRITEPAQHLLRGRAAGGDAA